MRKNLFKRLIALVIVCALMLSLIVTTYANTGIIIGMACYTDIVARINGHDIASFNVDGYTYIVAEDLRNYGFDVVWDPYSRSLSISRNPRIYTVASTYVKEPVPLSLVGVKSYDLLSTDIVTYINNSYVPSFNINGLTIIKFDELSRFGSMQWNASERKIELTMAGLEQKAVSLENLRAIDGKYPSLKFNIQNAYGTTFEKVIGGYTEEKWPLDQKYKKLILTVVPHISTTSYSSDKFKIYADDKEIYEAKPSETTKPFTIELDVTGCNILTIRNLKLTYI